MDREMIEDITILGIFILFVVFILSVIVITGFAMYDGYKDADYVHETNLYPAIYGQAMKMNNVNTIPEAMIKGVYDYQINNAKDVREIHLRLIQVNSKGTPVENTYTMIGTYKSNKWVFTNIRLVNSEVNTDGYYTS